MGVDCKPMRYCAGTLFPAKVSSMDHDDLTKNWHESPETAPRNAPVNSDSFCFVLEGDKSEGNLIQTDCKFH